MSKRRWNQSVGMLMITFAAMAILAMTGVTAAAETLSNINIDIPDDLLLAGSTYMESAYGLTENVTVDGNVCAVESIIWKDANGIALTDGSRLLNGNSYHVYVLLKANAGDRFDPSATVAVNREYETTPIDRYAHADYSKLWVEWKLMPIVYKEFWDLSLAEAPVAAPGNAALPYSYTYAEDGRDHYTVTGAWHVYNASSRSYEPMASTELFSENGSYQLALHLETMPGYIFSENIQIMANGQTAVADITGCFDRTCNLFYSVGNVIDEVFFTVQEPMPGQSFSDAVPITATVPADSHYTVQGNWIDENGNSTGVFTQGKDYYFDIIAYADDGYYFADAVWGDANSRYNVWATGEGKKFSASFRMSLKYPIDEVILLDAPKAEIGQKLPTEEFPIKVPADAEYWVTARWCDEQLNPVTDETVQAGKKYLLELYMHAEDGYQFAEEYILRINGIDHQEYGNASLDSYYLEHSFREQIHHVEVTGVVEPVAGQSPDTSSLKPADPAKYTIVDAVWYEQENGMPAVIFQDGHAYDLQVTVEATPGYEFVPYVSWKMGEGKGAGYSSTAPSCTLYSEHSLEMIIPEIRLSQLPSIKAGERVSTEIAVPSDAHYSANAEWEVWDEKVKVMERFDGIFEHGKTYRLRIWLHSHPGYRFANGRTACYLNDVLNPEASINMHNVFCIIDFPLSDAKVIQQVELSITKPLSGRHSSIRPQIKPAPGASYCEDISGGYNGWIVGDAHEWRIFEGYFAADRNYGVEFALAANEGYVFADDLLVVVNGVILPAEAYHLSNVHEMGGIYFFDMACQHSYQNGQCIGCHAADPAANLPKTGDSSRLALWFALLFLSGGTIFKLTIADRKRRV